MAYAVYNCTCIHKLVAIMRSIMESNLNYWDEVIVTNTFVSNIIQLYPWINICMSVNVS